MRLWRAVAEKRLKSQGEPVTLATAPPGSAARGAPSPGAAPGQGRPYYAAPCFRAGRGGRRGRQSIWSPFAPPSSLPRQPPRGAGPRGSGAGGRPETAGKLDRTRLRRTHRPGRGGAGAGRGRAGPCMQCAARARAAARPRQRGVAGHGRTGWSPVDARVEASVGYSGPGAPCRPRPMPGGGGRPGGGRRARPRSPQGEVAVGGARAPHDWRGRGRGGARPAPRRLPRVAPPAARARRRGARRGGGGPKAPHPRAVGVQIECTTHRPHATRPNTRRTQSRPAIWWRAVGARGPSKRAPGTGWHALSGAAAGKRARDERGRGGGGPAVLRRARGR
jgi:translation initiation factor IF-2